MKILIKVTVGSDDGQCAREMNAGVGVDTGIEGVDPDVEKEDFLDQARQLLGRIADTQLPALYAAVSKSAAAKMAEEAEKATAVNVPEKRGGRKNDHAGAAVHGNHA